MKTNSIGFIGGGRITKIILKAFSNKQINLENIKVFDANKDISLSLKGLFPEITIADTPNEVAKQSTVFIALHPPVIMDVLDKISGDMPKDSIVISLAPKITIEKISSKLKTDKIVRMIPNATSYINEGYNPVTFAADFDSYEKVDTLGMLMHLGKTFEANENTLEAYALISAMLPTYFWFQWEEISRLGSQMGLTPHESTETIVNTLEASINLMFKSGLTTSEVMDFIPVKPIGEQEAQINEIYRTKLMGLFEKIKP